MLQQDGNDELIDLSIRPGLQPAECPLPYDDDKDLLLGKLDLGVIRNAMAQSAVEKNINVEPSKMMLRQKLL